MATTGRELLVPVRNGLDGGEDGVGPNDDPSRRRRRLWICWAPVRSPFRSRPEGRKGIPTPTPEPEDKGLVYGSCEEAEAAGELRVQGSARARKRVPQ